MFAFASVIRGSGVRPGGREISVMRERIRGMIRGVIWGLGAVCASGGLRDCYEIIWRIPVEDGGAGSTCERQGASNIISEAGAPKHLPGIYPGGSSGQTPEAHPRRPGDPQGCPWDLPGSPWGPPWSPGDTPGRPGGCRRDSRNLIGNCEMLM
jgi:hypothetical protein